jgi:regulator of sigma E protease
MIRMNIVMALLALGFLIFIHELGHYWAARATGVRVEEFAVGFGPAIFKFERNNISYRLNWIPIGGYVRMLGEDNPGAAAAPDNFNNRPIWARVLVISAGVIMNLIGAVVILAILFNVYGVPQNKLIVAEVVAGSPAQVAGLQKGDQLYAVNNVTLADDFEAFNREVQHHTDKPMTVEVVRDGEHKTLTVTPRFNPAEGKTLVGIQIGQARHFVKEGTFGENVSKAVTDTGRMTVMMFDSFWKLITGSVPLKDIGGPVEIVRVTGQQAETGMPQFLFIVALISINLAVMNIIPFPALDGGRLVFLLIEWVRRGKRIPLEKEASINFVGILFLLTIMVLVTFKDVFHIFTQ